MALSNYNLTYTFLDIPLFNSLRGSTRAEVSHQTNNYLKRKHKTGLSNKGAEWKFQILLTLPLKILHRVSYSIYNKRG